MRNLFIGKELSVRGRGMIRSRSMEKVLSVTKCDFNAQVKKKKKY